MTMKIRIIKRKKPTDKNLETGLEWICSSLGFCEPIDKDKTAAAVFRTLLKHDYRKNGLRSDDISAEIGKSRGAVVHQLNKLIAAGLVIRKGTLYELREDTLCNTLIELKKDIERFFTDLEEIAKEIDDELRQM